MVDQEKVLKGLEHCCDPDRCDAGCPYYKDYDDVNDCMSKIAGDALELLKEQEPKPVIQERQCEVEPNVWERKGFCPKCNQIVLWSANRLFCGFCGQEVKWDG